MEKEKKYRLQVDFTERGYHELERLQKNLEATSKSEVIRNALGVLRWVTDEILDESRILVQKKGSREVEKVVFHFTPRPVPA